MSIEEWARRDAARIYSQGSADGLIPVEMLACADARAQGIAHAFDALLSDEAIFAGVDQLERNGFGCSDSEFRLALQAAINAVTEGSPE